MFILKNESLSRKYLVKNSEKPQDLEKVWGGGIEKIILPTSTEILSMPLT